MRYFFIVLILLFSYAKAEPLMPERLVGHGGPIRAISLSDDNQWALTASFDYSIILWHLSPHGAKIHHRFIGHNAAVNDVDFIPDSPFIVSVSDDGSFILWNRETLELLEKFDDTADKVLGLDVSPDGHFVAIARWDGTARLFDIEKLEEIAKLEGHRGNVNAVRFSPDGQTLYSASYDGTIRAWEGTTGNLIRPLHDFGWGINVLEVSHDNRTLFYGALNGTLASLNLENPSLSNEIAKYERPVLAIALSPDGKTLAAGNGAGYIHLYDTKSLEPKRDAIGSFGPIWGLAFTKQEDTLYHVGLDDFATYHDMREGSTFQPVKGEFPRRFQLNEADEAGALEFNRKCSVCHTLSPDDANRAGPTLYKVFGRKAGILKDYPYSKALKESGIIWNEETIAQLFVDGPDVMVPGTKMPVQRLKSVERLDELVTFLKKATNPEKQDKKIDGAEK